ncbi:MAG TPA: hypothetical protein PLB89_04815 [Flavobacteriales bacterium]|nr:hypothetical protein [Flavobacteriales bacterium]
MLTLPTTIDTIQEPNTAGGCKLTVVPVEDIDTFPNEVNGTLAEITLTETGYWREIKGTQWTQAFAEAWEVLGGSQVSRASCALLLPKDRPLLLDGLWRMKAIRCVVLHHDMNGTIKVMGTKEEPAMVRVVKLEHGTVPGASGSRNSYALVVEVTRRRMCPFYEADPPAVGAPGSCPTLATQISEASWATIEGLLSGPQLAAAEASLCDCETLAELLEPETGAAIWALLSPTQQAQVLTAAGIVSFTGIRDDMPGGNDTSFMDPTP